MSDDELESESRDGHYAAFLISFAVIAAAWRDHHDIFRYAKHIDSRLRTLNTGLAADDRSRTSWRPALHDG